MRRNDGDFDTVGNANRAPVTFGKRSDAIYDELFRRIVSGEVPPGGKLPTENALTELFGVSRPIVRQALDRLRAEGIIESRRGAGSFVRETEHLDTRNLDVEYRMAECLRLYEYRLTLEPGIAAIAAKRCTPAALEAIRQAVESDLESLQAREVEANRDMNVHLAVAAATANNHLVNAIMMVRSEINLNTFFVRHVMCLAPDSSQLDVVCEQHLAIYETIARRDPEAARATMRQHLETGRNFILERNLELLKQGG